MRAGFAETRVGILVSVLKSESAPKQALESFSRRVWRCGAQHFQNVAQRSAKLRGKLILRPLPGHFL
jgi:hypothetical protein